MNIGVTAGSRQADILHTMQCPVKEYPSMEEGMKALLDKKIQAFAQERLPFPISLNTSIGTG